MLPDNWRDAVAELRRELAAVKNENAGLRDELIKLRRTYDDQINNLDLDNMPTVRKVALQTEDGVAGLAFKLNETNAEVQALAAVQTEQGSNIARIDVKADEAVSEVAIAVERSVNAENAANEANKNVSNGAYIIARVNEDGSLVKIKADKLELSGYATFLSLKTAGATEIDGANLKTGTVSADCIALNENGQINFYKLGTLSFSEPSGATGEIRISENEYGKGEIGINADGTVAIGAGSAAIMLLDTGNGTTEASVDADSFRMNGSSGISGTYYFGDGSITVENGIVISASDGSGDYEPIELSAPEISLNSEYYYFSINNPNGVGTIYYQTYWYDDYGGSWESEIESDSNMSVSGDIYEYPSSGGYVGVRAWVEYDGHVSESASTEASYA